MQQHHLERGNEICGCTCLLVQLMEAILQQSKQSVKHVRGRFEMQQVSMCLCSDPNLIGLACAREDMSRKGGGTLTLRKEEGGGGMSAGGGKFPVAGFSWEVLWRPWQCSMVDSWEQSASSYQVLARYFVEGRSGALCRCFVLCRTVRCCL